MFTDKGTLTYTMKHLLVVEKGQCKEFMVAQYSASKRGRGVEG